jgi:hypothetical protein
MHNEKRRCPRHGHLLWPKAQVRPIRFHDLRHTTASLLMMAGANPAAAQRILRHADPRITTEVYGHLAPNYLREEIDRLRFGVGDLVPVDHPRLYRHRVHDGRARGARARAGEQCDSDCRRRSRHPDLASGATPWTS